MGTVITKTGTQFGMFSLGGIEILKALATVASRGTGNLVITSGTDGLHSGIGDPHHTGNAYDIRSQDLTAEEKEPFIQAVLAELGGNPQPNSGGFVTEKFFMWLEQAGTDNEHFHVQLRHGVEFP